MMLATASDPSDAAVLQRIYELRGDVRRRDAWPNDGRCGKVAAALETEFGWQSQYGYLRLLDGTVSWVHCWNRLADGTIVDATADQYQGLWLGDVVTVDPTSPMSANYPHAPREWELRFSRGSNGERVEGVTCVSGDDVQVLSPDDPDRPWLSLARGVLRVLTGWELNDDLAGLAARSLRAKATTAEAASTADLIHPLVIASIQHLGGRGTQAWIASEFLEPI
ncbi:hypothetical protein [Actinopolymorpha pittospori]|uniref:Uncharacterized protein n=1 Tax=Actinopolymorpha pittospori TaxID=648752 RepID=A0A927RBN7_9ACTN|nr:hypothetical protein [Actinopolymorpha pittospori]MBE1608959.1 hypothetical protein [Actinopolymorpha pittospori]